MTALVNAASLARETPAVYVVEDAHWIDEVSESMLAEFLTVIPQSPSMVLLTYRPEYRGALTGVADAQTLALTPLSDPETTALVSQLLGPDPSVGGVATVIAEKAAGNPFFTEEIVRDLAERGVLRGNRSAYESTADAAEVSVPATLQATIAARIDRLDPNAKRTLSAAAVVGSRFGLDLLTVLGVEPAIADLVAAQLIDQVKFTPHPVYAFHHPMIRTVAYEAQLKSDRAELHRRLAAAIETRDPASADEKAAVIAEHLEAAGDLHAAFGWHMRAGAWSSSRDITAARTSWQRARLVADRLADDDPDRLVMRIAPRTMLCGTAYHSAAALADTGFDELRDLCTAAGDKRSLAISMFGQIIEYMLRARVREASRAASEMVALTESIGDPALTLGNSVAAIIVKQGAGAMAEVLGLAQNAIDLADGDSTKGNLFIPSPLAWALVWRGIARWHFGQDGWRTDVDDAVAMARSTDPLAHTTVVAYKYLGAIPNGVLLVDDSALDEIEDAFRIAERLGDDNALALSTYALGVALVHWDAEAERGCGQELLAQVHDMLRARAVLCDRIARLRVFLARERARRGDSDDAIPLMQSAPRRPCSDLGRVTSWSSPTSANLVETLLDRGADGDVTEAEAAIERMAAAPADDGPVDT